MSTLKLTGSSSGSTSLQAPASGSDRTITFPNNAGTVLTNASTGCIIQVQENTDKTSISTVTMADKDVWYDVTDLNASITPSSTSNKILISFMGFGEGSRADHLYRWRIKKTISSSDSYITAAGSSNRVGCMGMVTTSYHADDSTGTPTIWGCSNYLDNPSTTSAITYTIQINCPYDTTTWITNRSYSTTDTNSYEIGMSYMTLMEVAG